MAETKEGSSSEMSLKDQGNEFFNSGKYLKAAALYTQAIKKDSSNPTLYSNRAAALLQLDKLNKQCLNPEKNIFQRFCLNKHPGTFSERVHIGGHETI
jgi:tetratricopeptide (TPR) repeat protein